jgi:hypothetical protein
MANQVPNVPVRFDSTDPPVRPLSPDDLLYANGAKPCRTRGCQFYPRESTQDRVSTPDSCCINTMTIYRTGGTVTRPTSAVWPGQP